MENLTVKASNGAKLELLFNDGSYLKSLVAKNEHVLKAKFMLRPATANILLKFLQEHGSVYEPNVFLRMYSFLYENEMNSTTTTIECQARLKKFSIKGSDMWSFQFYTMYTKINEFVRCI